MSKTATRATTPTARVSNFTSGFGRRTLRTCTVSTLGHSIILKDEHEHKQMSIAPSREALEYLREFCESALHEVEES